LPQDPVDKQLSLMRIIVTVKTESLQIFQFFFAHALVCEVVNMDGFVSATAFTDPIRSIHHFGDACFPFIGCLINFIVIPPLLLPLFMDCLCDRM